MALRLRDKYSVWHGNRHLAVCFNLSVLISLKAHQFGLAAARDLLFGASAASACCDDVATSFIYLNAYFAKLFHIILFLQLNLGLGWSIRQLYC